MSITPEKNKHSDQAHTIESLAKHWRCGKTTIRDMIACGELEAFRVRNKLLRISADEVRRYESQGPCSNSSKTNLDIGQYLAPITGNVLDAASKPPATQKQKKRSRLLRNVSENVISMAKQR